ncbi:Profilin [Trichophyton interdigitale]|uniref:Profilin n=2 Tax=Trichophyton interdigitale TaxID=101480 RepID=A0A9P4YMQ7_9EURO|nr:Profilin [Trichophyton interdigitale]KAF3900417.1 Profilin [Trichophyton interdigitale]KAG8211209.1 Profilin [Trichophyton interdigitale]KDB26138.1 hypothetical protein H109_02054 [Trichophyton interdigitale MR816]
MSWQERTSNTLTLSLVGSGNIDQAAIFDKDGTSAWATSPGFKVSPEEMKVIIDSFSASDNIKDIQTNGFHVGGEKFFTLRADDSRVYGKLGKTGIVIVRTKMALLLAHYPETVQPGAATNTVEALAEYLKGVGY